MDNKEIKALALELMDAAISRKIAEFSLETGDFTISFKTEAQKTVQQIAPPSAETQVAAVVVSETSIENMPLGTCVEAPLVGIFYSASSPDNPPFVEVGQQVKKGDTLFVIEAMKTMNEINAPCDGIVSRIFAQNGDMIEYKQVVVIIE